MPDIDSLMQEWPGELEELLHELRLPNATLDLDLDNYAGLICGECDVFTTLITAIIDCGNSIYIILCIHFSSSMLH